jgi:prepilin-type N-terminal cleavage/methylation domain-containing protein
MLKIRKKMGKKGLTLIELLVTIAVLAVVAAIAVPVVGNVINNANEQAVAQTEADIASFTEKYSKSGGYTYDPSTGTFAGYADLNGDGTATEDEKIEEFDVDLDKFSVGSVGGDVPTSAAEIDFDNPVAGSFSIIDYTVTLTPESLTVNGWVNNAISATSASLDGAQGTITWTVSEGTLPTGLSLNPSTGIVTGTPTETYTLDTVVIQATDENGVTVTQSHSYDIAPEPTLTPASVTTNGLVGESLSTANASLSGFTEPYTWEITSGSLPTGLNLNTSTGTISGTPTEAGTSGLTIMLTDANSLTASQTHEFTIEAPSLYEFTSATFTPGGSTGRTGPTLTEIRSGVGNPTWGNSYIEEGDYQGQILWTVPEDATYRFEVAGGQGGDGGAGARMRGDFSLTEGEKIRMVVGQEGMVSSSTYSGGGGSFVAKDDYTPLIVAAGGGGRGSGGSASIGSDRAGSNCAAGAGYTANGNTSNTGSRAGAFRGGDALGGRFSRTGGSNDGGGFGGGAGGQADGSFNGNDNGGGGGYQGGDGDCNGPGSGGLSYNDGSNQNNVSSTRNGDGYIEITKL